MSTLTVPQPLPTPEEDCHKLYKAFKGWGTDEKAIIEILGRRSAVQRREIREVYARLFPKSLIDSLHSELSGDFRRAVILWVQDPAERDATLAHEALKKKGYRHASIIVEIACASSPDHLIAVRQAYCFLYYSSLEEDIINYYSRHPFLTQLLVRLVSSYRYDGMYVNENLVDTDAAELYNAIKLWQQEPPTGLVNILSTRSFHHLKESFHCYQKTNGKSFYEDVESNKSYDNELKSILITVVCCIESPEKHFAEVVRTSVVSLGTDEDSLTRAIVTRAEIDMKNIKEEYMIRYKTTVNADIIGDTSGDYKNFLLTLVGSAEP
ncbi:annexin D3 [Dioscorea cayenensis subsp. rotundata]|uniref:Annexin n=1 Tax=Dioscorea cayennensis subsp. rotundata TaxID=55577 RepID=A0AB40BRT1_DIOCR|nr:annexin D3 [Dioscorea cayenensis subsp. rotundata]